MNIYKLDNDELQKLSKEFNRTPFGVRILAASIFPFYIFIYTIMVLGIYCIYERFGVEFFGKSPSPAYTQIVLFGILIAVVLMLFVFLMKIQYFKFLKEYAETKNKKSAKS